jgi:hypothetical protein
MVDEGVVAVFVTDFVQTDNGKNILHVVGVGHRATIPTGSDVAMRDLVPGRRPPCASSFLNLLQGDPGEAQKVMTCTRAITRATITQVPNTIMTAQPITGARVRRTLAR